MGQVLHGCATTTEAVRRAIQNSQESLRALAKRYGVNQKTVAKWKKRGSVADRPTGPKEPKSTSLSLEDEAIVVAFRKHTLLPLDGCLCALQATIPHLTRSAASKGSMSTVCTFQSTPPRGGRLRQDRVLIEQAKPSAAREQLQASAAKRTSFGLETSAP